MSMLELVPKSWLSKSFDVFENGSAVAEIDVSWWREKGVLLVNGARYEVYREGVMHGAFILESNGTQLARAEKPSAFFRSFTVEQGGRTYTLKAESAMRRKFIVLENSREVGAITPTAMFTRKARVELPDNLALPVKVFIIWLVVLLWKRESDAGAATAGSS